MRLVELKIHERGTFKLHEGTEDRPLPRGAIAELRFDVIQESDRLNGNGRAYPWEVLKEASNRLLGTLKEEALPAFDGHPKSNDDMQIAKAPAVLSSYELDEATGTVRNGVFYLVDSEAGRHALAHARLGVRIGTSSRGEGSLREGSYDGRYGKISGAIVQKDLVFEGWDLVVKPSVRTAKSTGLREEQNDEGAEMQIKDLSELKAQHPELYRSLVKEAYGQCQGVLKEQIDKFEGEIKEQCRDQVRQEVTAELTESLEKPLLKKIAEVETALLAEKKKVEESLKEKQKLSESATSNEQRLQEQAQQLKSQLDETAQKHQTELTKLQESLAGIQLREAQTSASRKVISETDGLPDKQRDVLRVSVLGVFDEKKNPFGVKVSEALSKKHASDIVPLITR
jgi:hypothetical protein